MSPGFAPGSGITRSGSLTAASSSVKQPHVEGAVITAEFQCSFSVGKLRLREGQAFHGGDTGGQWGS